MPADRSNSRANDALLHRIAIRDLGLSGNLAGDWVDSEQLAIFQDDEELIAGLGMQMKVHPPRWERSETEVPISRRGVKNNHSVCSEVANQKSKASSPGHIPNHAAGRKRCWVRNRARCHTVSSDLIDDHSVGTTEGQKNSSFSFAMQAGAIHALQCRSVRPTQFDSVWQAFAIRRDGHGDESPDRLGNAVMLGARFDSSATL